VLFVGQYDEALKPARISIPRVQYLNSIIIIKRITLFCLNIFSQ
jgi:hypothetical protein